MTPLVVTYREHDRDLCDAYHTPRHVLTARERKAQERNRRSRHTKKGGKR